MKNQFCAISILGSKKTRTVNILCLLIFCTFEHSEKMEEEFSFYLIYIYIYKMYLGFICFTEIQKIIVIGKRMNLQSSVVYFDQLSGTCQSWSKYTTFNKEKISDFFKF